MKKILITMGAVAMAAFAQASTVDWGYTGSASEEGYKIYLYTAAVESSYTSFEDLIAASFADGTVAMKKAGPKTYYKVADNPVGSDSLGNTLYYVLVSGSDATTYTYGSSSISAYTYDPGNQETSPGTLALTSADFSQNGTIGGPTPPGPGPEPVPEPTSGLLVLLGVAGLALRRRA